MILFYPANFILESLKNGKRFSTVRRIWPDVSQFNQELWKCGFQIISQEQEAPADETSVWMERTRVKRSG